MVASGLDAAAFDPPPTHATTTSGSFPNWAKLCCFVSVPITLWKSRTIAGNGCGPTTLPMM